MSNRVLILVGLPGSGKTTAGEFFSKKKIPVIRMGDVTDEFLKQSGKSPTETNEFGVRDDLRRTRGEDIYAKLTLPHVVDRLKAHPVIVIEGMMSEQERTYFESKLEHIQIIFIESSKTARHQRLKNRKARPLNDDEADNRDHYEIDTLGKMELKKDADIVIANDGTLEEFYMKLNTIL